MTAIASLEPTRLTVTPGGQATLVVRVRNGGSIVDRFDIAVVGPLAAWATAQPASLSLFPGQEGQATIVVAPPRASLPRAGTYPYGVRVAPAANPSGATVEEGRATVEAFVELAAEIVPQTSRSRRVGRHQVVVENHGNAPVEVVVGAADPDRLLSFGVEPDRLAIGPGEQAAAKVRATAGDTFMLGTKQTHPFSVEIASTAAKPIALRGALLQGPMLPSWLVPAGGLAVALIAAAVALPILAGGRDDDSASGPTASALVTPAPSTLEPGSPSPSAPASEEPSESPSDGAPTTSPTPGPFVVELPIEDETVMGGALRLRCPENDRSCRAEAADTLQLFINALAGRYDGYGVANPANPDVPNTLPVVLRRDTPFNWRSDTGASGTSKLLLVDLAPLVADTPSWAYAVVETGDGTTQRFVVAHAIARQVFETLYEPTPQVELPDWTLPDKPDISQVYVWNNAFYDDLFAQVASPAP